MNIECMSNCNLLYSPVEHTFREYQRQYASHLLSLHQIVSSMLLIKPPPRCSCQHSKEISVEIVPNSQRLVQRICLVQESQLPALAA